MSAGSPPVVAAALIRADIRAAIGDGMLGVLPAAISFSVRASDFATAPGVTVTVYGDGEWIFTGPGREHLTPECDLLRQKLLMIADHRRDEMVLGGFTRVELIGRQTPDEETMRLTGSPSARGDIPGHPKPRRKG